MKPKISGVHNEMALLEFIHEIILKYGRGINILFDSGVNQYQANNILYAYHEGRLTSHRKKTDVVLLSGDCEYNLSIKKSDAQFWESAETYWRQTADEILNGLVTQGHTSVLKQDNIYQIIPSVAIEATKEEEEHIVFGSDILPNGCILSQTFNDPIHTYDRVTNTVTISVKNVITSPETIPPFMRVWFLLRNEATRNSLPRYPGIRLQAVYRSRAFSGSTKQILRVQRDDLWNRL